MKLGVDELKSLGLTDYQARTYLALKSGGEMKVREISDATRIPSAKMYDVLSELIHKGLVNEKTIVIKHLKRKTSIKKDITELQKKADKLGVRIVTRGQNKNPFRVWEALDMEKFLNGKIEIIDKRLAYINSLKKICK